MRYLGVTSPADLAPYGLSSAGELVDLISRVSRIDKSSRDIMLTVLAVHNECLHLDLLLARPHRGVRIPCLCIYQPLLRAQYCTCIPSYVIKRLAGASNAAHILTTRCC